VFQLSSIWNCILDNFRPISVWATELFIYFYVNPKFGESWTASSYLQIAGLVVLLYGTAIYNAPNDGSLLLERQWWEFGIDLSEEYTMILCQQNQDNLGAGGNTATVYSTPVETVEEDHDVMGAIKGTCMEEAMLTGNGIV